MKNIMKNIATPLVASAIIVAGLAGAAATDAIPNPLPNAVAGNVIKATDINDIATAVGILDERTGYLGYGIDGEVSISTPVGKNALFSFEGTAGNPDMKSIKFLASGINQAEIGVTDAASNLIFSTNGTERIMVNRDGNLEVLNEGFSMKVASGSKKLIPTNQWVDMFKVNHTSSGDINLITVSPLGVPTSSMSSSFSFSSAYGYNALELEEVANGGKGIISDVQVRYLNSGGSAPFIMQVYVTSTETEADVHWGWSGLSTGNILAL